MRAPEGLAISTRECWNHHITCEVLKLPRFENDLYQDKALQPRVWPARGPNGPNGTTKGLLVQAAQFQFFFPCILEWSYS